MNFWQRLWTVIDGVLHSRKFWVLVGSVVTAAAGLATGQITFLQFLIAVIGALSIYSTGVAVEDGLSKRG